MQLMQLMQLTSPDTWFNGMGKSMGTKLLLSFTIVAVNMALVLSCDDSPSTRGDARAGGDVAVDGYAKADGGAVADGASAGDVGNEADTETDVPPVECDGLVPVISAVEGELRQGAAVVIVGGCLGVKTAVESLLWDNAETAYGGSPVDGESVPVGAELPFAENTDGDIEFATAASRDMRGVSEAHYIGFGANRKTNVLKGHDYNPEGVGHGYQEFYLTWYVRIDSPSASKASAKLIRLWAGAHNGRTYRLSWTTMHMTYSYSEDIGTEDDRWASVSHDLLNGSDWRTWSGESELGQWHRVEVYFKASTSPDTADGRILCVTDGRADHDRHLATWIPERAALPTEFRDHVRGGNDPLNKVAMIGLDPSVEIGDYIVEFDDVYVDSTPARVELCDRPTWSERAGAHCEVQPTHTTWQQDRVNVRFNQGSFVVGDSTWLYVIRPDQAVNEAGLPIEIQD